MKARYSTRLKVIVVSLVGLIVMGTTAYFLYPSSGETLKDPKFAYCRTCDKELTVQPGKDLPICPKCAKEMVGMAESVKKAGKPKNQFGPLTVAGIVETVIFLVILYFVAKPPSVKVQEEDYLTVRCAQCSRKLKYRESQQGNFGQCPLCKKPLRFPQQTPIPGASAITPR